ncbi:MAG: hypothetical protein J6J60_01570 [Clostridia bacterium]|nr:hypothetical protein [Clostridia bacterium]
MKIKVNKKKTAIILFLIVVVFICGNAFAALLGAPNVFFAVKELVDKDVELKGKEELLLEDDKKDETNVVVVDEEEKENKDIANIVLYNGMEMSVKTGIQTLSDIKISKEADNKYNTKYYNYEKGKSKGTSEGEFGKETYEGYSVVTNVKKIAMTADYDAIPRTFKEIKELPEELSDMADYTEVNIHEIDLDGDNKKEHIVCYKLDYKAGTIGDGEPAADSGIMLYDEDYKKIADLVTLKDGFWGNVKEEGKKVFVTLDDVEYIDLDNDEEMEIIIDLPTYDGTTLSVLKYSNNKLEGEKNYIAKVYEGKADNKEENLDDLESNANTSTNATGEKLIQFDNSFFNIEEVAKEYREYKNIKNYKDFEYDFDGDGKKDKVTIKNKNENSEDAYEIKFNGENFIDNSYLDKLYIVDLNENDKNIEVVIESNGPSDDPMYIIYSQKGNKMERVETIMGSDLKTDKQGTILIEDCYNGATTPEIYFDYHFIKDGKITKKDIDLNKINGKEFKLETTTLYFSEDFDNLKKLYEELELNDEAFEKHNIKNLSENTTFKILKVEKEVTEHEIEEYKIHVELSNGQKGYIFYVQLAG